MPSAEAVKAGVDKIKKIAEEEAKRRVADRLRKEENEKRDRERKAENEKRDRERKEKHGV